MDLIKVLQASSTLPIARARMRVRVTIPAKEGKRLKEKILALVSKVEDDDWGESWELVSSIAPFLDQFRTDGVSQVALIDPGSFKLIGELIESSEAKGNRGKVETLSFSAVEGDERIE